MATPVEIRSEPRFPLLSLLHPREQTRAVVVVLGLGLLLWGVVVWIAGLPIWGATTIVLALLLVPGVHLGLGTAALAAMLLASYAGILARAAGGRRQYGGMLGKADRMLLLALAGPAALLFDAALVFNGTLAVVLVGGLVTLGQRLRASYAELTQP